MFCVKHKFYYGTLRQAYCATRSYLLFIVIYEMKSCQAVVINKHCVVIVLNNSQNGK